MLHLKFSVKATESETDVLLEDWYVEFFILQRFGPSTSLNFKEKSNRTQIQH